MTTTPDEAPPHFAASFADEGLRTFATEHFKTADEAVGFAQRYHGFKDVDPANLMAVPGELTPEAIMPILRRLGAPEKGDAYKLGERQGADAEFATHMSELLASAGLAPWQAQLLVDGFEKYTGERTGKDKAAFETSTKQALEREQAALKLELGGEYDAKIELGRRAMRTAASKMGMDEAQATELIGHLEAFTGYSGVIKMMAFFGGLMKEGDFVDGKADTGQPNNILATMYPNEWAAQNGGR